MIIKFLVADDEFLALFSHLMQYPNLFAKAFWCVNFSHVCRQDNSIAHNLAKDNIHVINLSMYAVFLNEISVF